MKPIRHLIVIVFLLCGLSARGSERGYDHDDMVASTACDASCKHFGNWEIKGDLLILHFDKQGTGSLHVNSELDQYVMQEGYEKW